MIASVPFMRRICLPITVAAALLFARALLTLACSEAPLHDDADNAIVARNLVEGRGYRSAVPRARAFDPEITTGPVVLLPVALALRLLGAVPEAPNLAAALLSLALWAALLLLVFRSGPHGPLVAAGLSLLVLGRAAPGEPWPYGFWYTALGEVPGLLWCAIGLCLVCEPTGTRRRTAGALAIGLSLSCKIAFAPFAAAALVAALAGRERRAWRKTSAR